MQPPVRSQEALLTIGDIVIYPDRVSTPLGERPIADVSFTLRDQSTTTEKMPAVAIVLAIIFFFVCLLGLLFLLMKEKTTTGYVEVTVQGDGLYYTAQVPVNSPQAIDLVRQQVDYSRSVAAYAQGNSTA